MSYLISIYRHKMNKPKRNTILDSFIIKKPKNISKASSNPNLSEDSHTETTDVNLDQHAISNQVNEMTTSLLSPENNRDDLINSTLTKKIQSYLLLIFNVLILRMLILSYKNRLVFLFIHNVP